MARTAWEKKKNLRNTMGHSKGRKWSVTRSRFVDWYWGSLYRSAEERALPSQRASSSALPGVIGKVQSSDTLA